MTIMDVCHDANRAEELEKENTELRSVVDRYNRRSESGECIGDYLDALEHNQDLVTELADLRAKLDEASAVIASYEALRKVNDVIFADLAREVCARRARKLRKRGAQVRYFGRTSTGKARYKWMPRT